AATRRGRCDVNAQRASAFVPSASPSQAWCGMMRQILTTSLEQQEEDQTGPSPTPAIPVGIAGIAGTHRQAHRIKIGARSTVVTQMLSPPIEAYSGDDSEDDRAGGGSGTTGALNPETIAMIATRARCQEALSFLNYVKRVLVEKGENAAAVAAAGYGWDWVEDNCRCVFDLLASVPAIGCLDLVFRRKLLWMLELVTRRKGDFLFRQDDEQETIWLILGGRVHVSSKDRHGTVHHAADFDPGQVIGNLLPEKRLASANCLDQCSLLRVNGITFREVLEDVEAQRAVLKKSFFKSVSLFKGLGERDLDRLTSAFQPVTLEAGDVLCREGERLDYLYLIQRGSLSLLKAFLPLPEPDGAEADSGGRQRQADRGTRELEMNVECVQHRRQAQHQSRSQKEEAVRPPVLDDKPPSEECGNNTSGNAQSAALARQPQQRRQSSPLSSFPMKVHHFNIGVVGRKEFIGEGGFTSAAFAGAGALEAPEGQDAKDVEQGSAIRARSPTPARGKAKVSGGSHANLPGRSSRQVGASYMVSAVAESRVDVFAAKVSQLLPMQAAALKACWMEGREVHRMKEREWKPEVLAARLRKQEAWEHTKRAIVLDSVRTALLEKRMGAGRTTGEEQRDGDGDRSREG
ncbi:unnamed protein product, partial [Scytosiphon promiscuus]